MIDNIFKNPLITDLITKKLKKTFKAEKLNCIVIFLNDKGDLDLNFYKEPVKVIKEGDYNSIKEIIKKQKNETEGNKS